MAAKTLADHDYHNTYIFEAGHDLGGNSCTQTMMVGLNKRWADLGVNDYNLPTYKNIRALIEQLVVDTKPLDDSVSYSTSDGKVSYTVGPDKDGKIVITKPHSTMTGEEFQRFKDGIGTFYKNVYHIDRDFFTTLNPINPLDPDEIFNRLDAPGKPARAIFRVSWANANQFAILESMVQERTAELRAEKQRVEQANVDLEIERHKSEELLLNILPEETATELKESGTATPRFYESASVLFTDFKGFTQPSATMTAEEVIDELDRKSVV